MTHPTPFESLSPPVADAFRRRGFTALTPVQEAVLAPDLAGRDLRISSQTGSGKTVAIGLVVAPTLPVLEARATPVVAAWRPAHPLVVLIAPTRELASQLARELSWLLAGLNARVCAVTGGTRMDEELSSLGRQPTVVVGTPGRLLDHLERGSIDPTSVGTVVLDEADQMLDLGFRDELEAILGKLPTERRTHLVSATFPRAVLTLAERYQRDAIAVEGSTPGASHADIAHVAHLVLPAERGAALVNLLRIAPSDRTLVFVRTRADATDVAAELVHRGFTAAALSGDLEQRDRTRTLDAFRRGVLDVIVATDVAARGLDVPDVGRVVHFDPPTEADLYVHRSGRTGRAGRKGTSILLCPRPAYEMVTRILRAAGVTAQWKPVPSADDVARFAVARLREALAAEVPSVASREHALASSLLSDTDPVALVAALLKRLPDATGGGESVTPVAMPEARRPQTPRRLEPSRSMGFTKFRVNWGARAGADPRRLLALACRRGGISSREIGAIHIGPSTSVIEVANDCANRFARSVKKPDTRDRRTYFALLDAAVG